MTRPSLHVLGQELRVLARPVASSVDVCAFEQRLAPGQRIIWNVHRDHTEINRVISGSLLFEVDGKTGEAGPGSSVVVPAGCWHTLQGGQRGARLVLGFSPGDIFSMFEELERWPHGETPDHASFSSILARYGSEAR